MQEFSFVFSTGSGRYEKSIEYKCFGLDREDAKVLALQAMRGSYFKLKEESEK